MVRAGTSGLISGATGSRIVDCACNPKTAVKDYAFAAHSGSLGRKPPEQFKEWMVKYDYDPEHRKNMPTNINRESVSGRQGEPGAASVIAGEG